MSNGVDDSFGHYFARNFVFDRGLLAMFAGADTEVDFGHHKINRLIHQFKGSAYTGFPSRSPILQMRRKPTNNYLLSILVPKKVQPETPTGVS